ncbi:MAG: hypothetical protein QW579_06320 [Desulfurococcaceae archaeon]
MSEGNDVINNECHSVYGMLLCVGDYVEVYPRSRSLAFFRGRVKRITISSVILENDENDMMIRFSEIKAIRKLKPPKP